MAGFGNVNNETESMSQVVQKSFLPTAEVTTVAADFKTALSRLYNKPYQFMSQFADPNTDEITVEGFAPVDKNSPAASMIAAYHLNEIQIQMETSMNYLNFIYKTLPQMIEKSL